MLVINDNNVILTRGDTARLSVPIENETTGQAYTMDAGDRLTLTLKVSEYDKSIVMQKTVVGTNNFHIQPEDTKDLEFGVYVYDVQLDTHDGDVHTVIGSPMMKTFEIAGEVT